MKTLARFFDSNLAPIIISFVVLFLYTLLKGTDFYTALFGSMFFSLIGGWIFAIPITHFLASIFENLSH